jgi:hypothetical protein
MDNKERTRELIGKGLLALLVGLSLMAVGILVDRQLRYVWSFWPSTDGVVVRGTVQETLETPYTKFGVLRRYTPRIQFQYVVSGRTYISESNSVYTAATFGDAKAKMARLYQPGTHHLLRYNPRDPEDIRFGSIQSAPLGLAFLLVFFGVVVLAVGLNWTVLGFSRRRERAAPKEQVPTTVLPFADRTRPEPTEATVVCPGCGRRVEAGEDNCPNCLRPLRAA